MFDETYHARGFMYCPILQVYLAKRDHYRQIIETFDDDLHVLSKVMTMMIMLNT